MVLPTSTLATVGDKFESEEGEVLSTEEQERALLFSGKNDSPEDGGQEAHDKAAVKMLKARAVLEMAWRGIHIVATDNSQVLALFHKVCLSLYCAYCC